MNVYPIGNNLIVKWTLRYSDGTVFPLSLYDYDLSYRTSRGVKVATDTTVEDNILRWMLKADDQVVSGPYSLELKISFAGNKAVDLQYNNAFALTSLSHGNGANVEVCIESNCDMIDLKDAVLQARKAMDVSLAAKDIAGSAVNTADGAEATANEAKTIANNAKTVAEKAATDASRDAFAAQQAAQTASDHITSLQQAIAELPDGQAVTEKVAEHTTKLSELGGEVKSKVDAYIHQELNRKIVASIGKWTSDFESCTLSIKVKMPKTTDTAFMLNWGAANYMIISGSSMTLRINNVIAGNVVDVRPYLDKVVVIDIVKTANNWKIFIDGVQLSNYNNITDSAPVDNELYLLCYKDAYGSNALADLYYLTLTSNGSSILTINASTNFVENTADIYMFGKNVSGAKSKDFADVFKNNEILNGEFTLNKSIVVPDGTHIRGHNCKVTFTNVTASITLGNDCSIEGIIFDGNSPYARQSKTDVHPDINPEYRYDLEPVVSVNDVSRIESVWGQRAFIYLDGKNASVTNCSFVNMYATTSAIRMVSSDNSTYNGVKQNSVTNCHFNDCFLAIDYRSEFGRIIGNEFKNCAFGIYAKAGNLNLSACHFVRCDIGLVIANSGNGGHSQYNGCEWAHNGLFGIYADMLPTRLGVVITGCQFADAPIGGKIGGMCIVGSRLDTWFKFEYADGTGTCNMIHDSIFDLTTLSRDFPPSEYGNPGYLDKYFQIGQGCDVDLKNNVSLNPRYLPIGKINN